MMITMKHETVVEELLAYRESEQEKGITLGFEALAEGLDAEAREELRVRLDNVITAEQAFEFSWGGETLAEVSPAFVPLGVPGRYKVVEVVAEGGMGVLCRAEDLELSRPVAYKIMKPGRHQETIALKRFYHEAEITAKLIHPGIVPVFGRVTDATGMPAYASEFVQGQTFARKIELMRAIPVADRSARDAQRTALLQSFVATCQIVAYAHSRSVVHGDIKPLNIMIDDFGVTRLVDWGVARVALADEDRDELPGPGWIRPGTPLFMSSFDTPSSFPGDIYALGLTLNYILEEGGESKTSTEEAFPAFRAIVQKAMRASHAERYRTASELAQDVQNVLDDKPVDAYRDPWPTRMRRWGNTHRPMVYTSAALLGVAAVAGPVVGSREKYLRTTVEEQRSHAEHVVSEMLAQTETLGELQASVPKVRALLLQAVQLVQKRAARAVSNHEDLRSVAIDYYRTGIIHRLLGQYTQAEECFRSSVQLAESYLASAGEDVELTLVLASSLREWGISQFLQRGIKQAPLQWDQAAELLKPLETTSEKARLILAKLALAQGNFAKKAKESDQAVLEYQRCVQIIEEDYKLDPDSIDLCELKGSASYNEGVVRMLLASEQSNIRKNASDHDAFAPALALLRQSLGLREKLNRIDRGKPENRLDLAMTLNQFGNCLSKIKDKDNDAEAMYQRAIATLTDESGRFPGIPSISEEMAKAKSNLAKVLLKRGKRDEAVALLKGSVEELRRLSDAYPNARETHSILGLVQLALASARDSQADLKPLPLPEAYELRYQAALSFARALKATKEEVEQEDLRSKIKSIINRLHASGFFVEPQQRTRLVNEPLLAGFRDFEPGA